MKYIDADKLITEIKRLRKVNTKALKAEPIAPGFLCGRAQAFNYLLKFIHYLQQEQPDFPTTDEQMKEFLATHPKVEVPEKYKNPDWLFKKQEQQEVDLEKEIEKEWEKLEKDYSPSALDKSVVIVSGLVGQKQFSQIAKHFYELGKVLNARKEE